MALSVICAFIKLESIFDCFRTLLHRIASNYLKVTTKKALWVIRTCNKLEGFCYQKQCFGLFLHLVHCCVGIVGVNSITFSKNTLLATSVEVLPMLKEPTKKALWVITTCNKLEGFWYASCTLLHETNFVKSFTVSGFIFFTTSFVVRVLKGTNNDVIGYSNFQQIGRFFAPKTVFWTCFASCTLLHRTI